ncbi:hypothetical protein YDYSY3_05770 [Paenibacillus chitinolyticus]|uniref:WG repeat-containing protein n=1 Tax=Paenibacillus chitinolyticus TaxID=79263 RepID=UPI0026E4D41E|nr:WG repeat-containing protein [Paenibacillus chitinolyticus]GKS09577.1 hypothetical protein YDYSY3_05770 [Paenibacillus chitinolyticus]
MKKLVGFLLVFTLVFSMMAVTNANEASGSGSVPQPDYLPYAEVGVLSEGLAWYMEAGEETDSIGFIDTSGKIVIKARFEAAGIFHDGLAPVQIDGLWGYVDKTGQFAVPPIYTGVGRVFEEGFVQVVKDDKWGYVDKTGKEVIAFDYEDTNPFNNGLAPVKKNEKYGYINKEGKEVVPFQYEAASVFSEGRAMVKIKDKWGVIDQNGIEIEKPKFEEAFPYSRGLAAVKHEGMWGYIDLSGREVIQAHYDEARPFQEGDLAPVQVDGKWGYVNKEDTMIIRPQFMDVYTVFSEGLALVSIENEDEYEMLGYIDQTGKVVVPYSYDLMGSSFSGGLATVADGGQGSFYFMPNPLNVQTQEPQPQSALPSASKVMINGREVSPEAYNIGGNNFFKLRDLAMLLNGTNKGFEVGWDQDAKVIRLTTSKAYTEVGGELAATGQLSVKQAAPATAKLLVNSEEARFTAYTLDGNNYFKLRDLAQALDFNVSWDAASNALTIDTKSGYQPE